MEVPKVRLSPAEAALFRNADFILTKNSVLQKTVALLGNVQAVLASKASSIIKTASPPPKISKGENYLGLPYAVLDYPRIAGGDDLFFIRSMFWWGNFFSSTLQLAGTFKQNSITQLADACETLGRSGYVVGVNADPWVHHFEADNFREIRTVSKEDFPAILERSPHVKIAKRWPLDDWDSAEEKLVESWALLTKLAAANDANFPNGETGP